MSHLKLFLSFALTIALTACNSGGGGGAQTVGGGENAVAARSAPLATGDTDCPTGGVLVETGIDENGNGVLDTEEVDKAEKVCNGASGLQSLILLSDEDIGANCPVGGVRVDTGIDTNGNGILDAAEITDTKFVCNPGRDQLFEAKERLNAFDPEPFDSFGSAVAISGDYAVVGANIEDPDTITDAGAAYIFRRTGANTWDKGVKIVAPDKEDNDRFGVAVAISGQYVIVGAQLEDPDLGAGPIDTAGSAYIFRRTGINTWDNGVKINASDAESDDFFGFKVAISGDYAIVGAQQKNVSALNNAGAAYIFRRTGDNTWDVGTKLTSLNEKALANFGAAVSISGETALVGAAGENTAYVFERTDLNAWDKVTKIETVGLAGAFGNAVAISGNYALIGAPFEFDPDIGGQTGAAYIFRRSPDDSWDAGTKISAPDADKDDNFGFSLSISGNTAIVGAQSEDPEGKDSAGAAYVFQRIDLNAWDTGTKITATDAEENDFFGSSVGISGRTAIVGANGKDLVPLSNEGTAYIVR